jgi:hypothetical protein
VRLGILWPLLLASCATRSEGIVPRAVASGALGASESTSQVAQARDERTPPPLDALPFHLAVVSYPDKEGSELPNTLRLCPIQGRTFVCGVSAVPLVSTDEGVVESGAPVGTDTAPFELEGSVVASFGSVALGGWFVTADIGAGYRHAYRWERDSWTHVADWTSLAPQELAGWGDGLFASPVTVVQETMDAPLFSAGIIHPGKGHVSPVTLRALPARLPPGGFPLLAVADGGGAIVMVAQNGTKLVAERWGKEKAFQDHLDVLRDVGSGDVDVHAAAPDAYSAVVFGSVTNGATEAIFERFTGRAWAHGVLPVGVTRVVAYDRTAELGERVFAFSGKTLGLFERDGGSPIDRADSWRPLALPALPDAEWIKDVWLANDDAWLLVYPKESTRSPPRLLRMKPVKSVWVHPRALQVASSDSRTPTL